ncbi:MAG: YraN family protein [Clostridiales bacterium]|nr:YraN family protein [Clostridiales bacterium]MCD8133494.1 YraN family protein [Clostridiales bacterium]
MQNKRRVGAVKEDRAAEWLRHRGYRVLEKNFRCRFGEIDLIMTKDGCLVFVEVKYRSTGSCGAPQEAVDARKQQRICNAASCYLYMHHCPPDTPCRFDVAAISGDEIELISNAFPYCGNFKV